jgi:uncharacterized protein (TIRG00374 family)
MAPSSQKHKLLGLSVGLAVSALCLWLAMRGMLKDPGALRQIGNAFRTADYRMLLPYWLGLFLFYWLKSWRWRLLLRPMGDFQPLPQLFPPILIGFAFNNLFPAHLGELVRVFVFSRRHRVRYAAALTSVALERVFDILAIVAFLALGLFFVSGLDPAVRRSAVIGGAAATMIAAGAVVFVTWTQPFVRVFERLLGWAPFLPAGLRVKAARLLETAASGLTSLHNPTLVAGIVITSLAQWAINGWMIHLSLISFGIHVSLWVSCIVLGVVAFGVTIPASPGYFGVIQLCFMSVLKLFTEDQEAVFAASVFYQLAQYIPVTLIGLFFFNRTGLKMAQVDAVSEELPGDAAAGAVDC